MPSDLLIITAGSGFTEFAVRSYEGVLHVALRAQRDADDAIVQASAVLDRASALALADLLQRFAA
jgi:hypothetical protein